MRARAWHGAVAAVGVMVVLVVVAYVRGPGEPSAVPSVAATTPAPEPSPTVFPVARIPGLVPAEPAPSEWEDTEAVRTIRQHSVVLFWSSVINSRGFVQYQDLIENSSLRVGNTLVGRSWARVGPAPLTPLSVTEMADGTTVVELCSLVTARLSVDRSTAARVEPGREHQFLMRLVLSPLTEEERAVLGDRVDDYTSLRIRDEGFVDDDLGVTVTCPEVPVVVQEFEGWRDHLVAEVVG